AGDVYAVARERAAFEPGVGTAVHIHRATLAGKIAIDDTINQQRLAAAVDGDTPAEQAVPVVLDDAVADSARGAGDLDGAAAGAGDREALDGGAEGLGAVEDEHRAAAAVVEHGVRRARFGPQRDFLAAEAEFVGVAPGIGPRGDEHGVAVGGGVEGALDRPIFRRHAQGGLGQGGWGA